MRGHGLFLLALDAVDDARLGQVPDVDRWVQLLSRQFGQVELSAVLPATRLATKFSKLRSHGSASYLAIVLAPVGIIGDGGQLLLSYF